MYIFQKYVFLKYGFQKQLSIAINHKNKSKFDQIEWLLPKIQ